MHAGMTSLRFTLTDCEVDVVFFFILWLMYRHATVYSDYVIDMVKL